MRKILVICSVICVIGSACTQSKTENNKERITKSALSSNVEKNVRKLLEISGSGKVGMQLVENMVATYKTGMPQVSTEFWDDFVKDINADTLIELVIPIYVKYYTPEEIVRLIEFYETPLGKRVIEVTPLITQDSYVVGAEWGRGLSEKVMIKLKEKGYNLD